MLSRASLLSLSFLAVSSTLPVMAGTPAAASATAPAPAADKAGYTLFNPTPENAMREFDSDRPDKTNSAITVDAGHFQLEMGLANYTRDGHGANKQEAWVFGDTNLRVGLTNAVDLQLMVPFGLHADDKTGIGDLSVALKANLWGNDGGDSAAGVEAILSVPTGSHNFTADTVQAAFLAIYQQSLGSFDAGINTGASIVANDDTSHHTEIVSAISISHSLVGPVDIYGEFYSSVPTSHSSEWVGTIDTGLLWKVSKNVQLDAGVNFGVTHAADDLQIFVGVSWRM